MNSINAMSILTKILCQPIHSIYFSPTALATNVALWLLPSTKGAGPY